MPWSATIENICTLVCTTAIVLGLYYMGAGLWSFLGLILLCNLIYPIRSRGK